MFFPGTGINIPNLNVTIVLGGMSSGLAYAQL